MPHKGALCQLGGHEAAQEANPVIRSRALEHFRKTIGLEAAGFHVNVNQQTALIQNGPRSFEQVMDKVRAKLVEERRNQVSEYAIASQTHGETREGTGRNCGPQESRSMLGAST